MATAPDIFPRNARKLSSADVTILEFPEASGQTFVAGNFVYLASGYLALSPTGDYRILGIALNTASGTQGTQIPVEILDPDSQVIMNMKTSSGGANSNFTLVQTNLGLKYDIQSTATGYCNLDNADTTNPKFTVVGFHPNYAVGDVNAWVYAQPIASMLQTISAT